VVVHRRLSQVSVALQFDGAPKLIDDDENYLQPTRPSPLQGRKHARRRPALSPSSTGGSCRWYERPPPPILDAPENSNVLLRGVNRPNRTVALVRSYRWALRSSGPLGPSGGEPPFLIGGPVAAGAMSRPVRTCRAPTATC
jgi:hypothetical protein